MATKVWVGGTGSLDDPNQWSSTGAPAAGDVAVISIGTATASMEKLDGYELQLASPASVLDISDVQFGAHFVLDLPGGAGGSATLEAIGFNANYGVIQAIDPAGPASFSPPFTLDLSDLAPSAHCAGAAAVFLNAGTILDESGQPFAVQAKSADAVLINNGLMHLDASFMKADIGVSVQGTGTIETGHAITPATSALLLASIPEVTFGKAVGSGQNLVITDVAHIVLDDPAHFHALIHGFSPWLSPDVPRSYVDGFYQPEIILENSTVTSYAVANDVLSLWNGSSLVAQLRFAGHSYARDDFTITASNGSTIIEPTISVVPVGTASGTSMAAHVGLG